MNLLILLFSTWLAGASNQVGSVRYHVLTEQKEIWLEMPYVAEGSLVEVPEVGFSLNVLIKTNTNLNRPEVQKIRSQFPDYKLREVSTLRAVSATVDLGIEIPVEITEDPSKKAGFFSVVALLDREQAKAVISKIRSGDLPKIDINIERAIPTERILESIDFPTKKICEDLVARTRGQAVKTASVVASLLDLAGTTVRSIKSKSLREKAIERVVNQCLVVQSAKEESISKIFYVFESQRAMRVDRLQEITVDMVPTELNAVVESDWRIQ